MSTFYEGLTEEHQAVVEVVGGGILNKTPDEMRLIFEDIANRALVLGDKRRPVEVKQPELLYAEDIIRITDELRSDAGEPAVEVVRSSNTLSESSSFSESTLTTLITHDEKFMMKV